MKQDWNTGLIGDIYLERYILGELSQAQLQAMENRLARDPMLRQRLEAINAHKQAFEAKFPAEKMLREFEMAAESAKANRGHGPLLKRPSLMEWFVEAFTFGKGLQLAGALALLVLAVMPILKVNAPIESESIRLKGKQPELRLYRNTPMGPERLVSGDSAAPGDILQIEFHPGNFSFGAIFSVDGNGSVTRHWPARPNTSTALSKLPEHRLPEAFQLDQAPDFERFYFVISNNPIDVEPLAAQVAASSKQDIDWLTKHGPKSAKILNFVLKKASHP